MPTRPLNPCTTSGCPNKSTEGGPCFQHADPTKTRGWNHDGKSAAKRGYDRKWRDHTRPRILKRDNYLCQEHLRRGDYVPATTVDHKINKARGGSDEDSNLEALCTSCQLRKAGRESSL